MNNMSKFRFEQILLFCGIALLAASGLNVDAQAGGQVFFQTTTFGIVGLARNQVARLNVLNPGNAYGNRTPICSAEMKFLDDQGRELKSSTARVDWDKAVSLEIGHREVAHGAQRIHIRAVLRTAINPPDPSATSAPMPGSVCSFLPTLEIFDKDTGKTQLVLTDGRAILLNTPAVGRGTPSAK